LSRTAGVCKITEQADVRAAPASRIYVYPFRADTMKNLTPTRILPAVLSVLFAVAALGSTAAAAGRPQTPYAIPARCSVRPDPELKKLSVRARLDRAIASESGKYGIDSLLVEALMWKESRNKPNAVSPVGARGPMQLMPGTARRWGVRDPHNIEEAVCGGTAYLVWLMDFFDGDVALGLAGYNAGEGAVLKYRRNIPPYRETQDYVKRIAEIYEGLRKARGDSSRPPAPQALAAAVKVVAEAEGEREQAQAEKETSVFGERPVVRPRVRLRVGLE
jgi:Predicted soluble lytic transglycosylase fused to an ABC-type amino acid-binding protein